jgi:predicted GH43/DUF377 family glycosyl hydrolase
MEAVNNEQLSSAIKDIQGKNYDSAEKKLLTLLKGNISDSTRYQGLIHLVESTLYAGKKELSKEVFENMLLIPSVVSDSANKHRLYQNIPYFVSRFQGVNGDYKIRELVPHFVPTNPSVVFKDDKFVVSVRCVNYTVGEKRVFTAHGDERYMSKIYMMIMNKNFQLIKPFFLKDNAEIIRVAPNYLGHEDARLFYHKDELYFTSTFLETTTHFHCQMALSHVNLEKQEIDSTIMLQCQNMNENQKNWLPFSEDGKLFVVYRLSPFIVNEIDITTGAFKEVSRTNIATWTFPAFRGSAGPIPWKDGYLLIGHFVDNTHGKYNYYNKFIFMDKKTKKPLRVSETFYLEDHSVEFITGMTVSGMYLYITYGVNDKEAHAGRYTIDCVDRLTWYKTSY